MTKSALITGIDSFTGSYVSAELRKNGFKVFGSKYGNHSTSANVRSLDLLDRDSLQDYVEQIQPRVVVHLAGISRVLHQDKNQIYQTNIVGTRNLFEALSRVESTVKSIIFPSSAQIYGGAGTQALTEESEIHPKSDYAISKFAAELLHKGMFENLPVTVVRPFNYTGIGQSSEFLIPKMVGHFKTRAPQIELGNLDISRDFSDVRTVAWAYGQLANNPAPGEVFNLASGKATSLRDILEKLRVLTGHELRVISNSDLFRLGEVSAIRGDAGKLWAHIGEPPKISFEETLAWMLSE